MDVRGYLRLLGQRWVLIVSVALAVVAGAVAVTYTTSPEYASTARLYVATAKSSSIDAYRAGELSEQRIASYSELSRSRELAAAVIERLGLAMDPGQLAGQVTTEVVPKTVILALTVTAPDPAQAQSLTQGYAAVFIDMIRELETPQGLKSSPIKATIVDSAALSSEPVSPQPGKSLGLAVVVGLLFGLSYAVLRDSLDETITSIAELALLSDAPLLATINYDAGIARSRLITSVSPYSPSIESFRVLRTNLQFADVDARRRVVVVTSALQAEGKTTAALNLALALAAAGQRTLLIEGDLRRSQAASALGMDGSVGLTSILVGDVSADDAIQRHLNTPLDLLASGAPPPNPTELIQSKRMAELLAWARTTYDKVIIDAPGLLPVTDAAILASLSDGVMIVVRHGKSTPAHLRSAVDRLNSVDANILGLVFCMVPERGVPTARRYSATVTS
ncbi:polysaccharide biosynthesis tyrosine autokinase [Nocardioides sp. cx-173]|uniref:polysaccharide biosynthesis tyrosine autokinase n=1 Tax=Nocardioides sp. cx-173 TaxID=2898796 RepID=UPI001E5D8B03|nr:polysaccharide biosynthesis tyrosine autokinase [Nocardioides sp. cx-173]MCD4526930.1 polysaccharide biosynthesis tyrosine autokinase [Nocardioides sp. cx-173]UGB41282.1 polysaccharide biosynthesis tyrosine autokinase [Nocardioides sp. cx-173]